MKYKIMLALSSSASLSSKKINKTPLRPKGEKKVRKLSNRIIFLLTVVLMLLCMISISIITVNADDAEVSYTGQCGDSLTWTLYADGSFVVSGKGSMPNYSSSGMPWYAYKDSIKTVTVEDGVDKIGAYAFNACKAMESVTVGDSIESIGAYAFSHSPKLTEVTLGSSLKKIEGRAFFKCTSLTKVTFKGTTDWWIGGASHSTTGADLVAEELADPTTAALYLKTTYVEKYWFRRDHVHSYTAAVTTPTCTSKGFTTYNCACGDSYTDDETEIIPHNYENRLCTVCGVPIHTVDTGTCGVNTNWVLTSDGVLTISGNGDTEDYLVSVTKEQPYRAHEDKITKVVFEEGITSIGRGAFYGFTNITEVVFPDTLIAIHEYAFFGCSGIKSVVIPENTFYIGMYAFRKTGITALTMPILDAWEFTDGTKLDIDTMIKAFTTNATYKQTCIRTVFEDGEIIAEGVFGAKGQLSWTLTSTGVLTVSGKGNMPKFNVNTTPWYGYRGAIRSVVIEEGITSVGRCSFHTCRAITEITLAESIETVSEYAFYNCQFLTEATIPANVTRIEIFAFRKCYQLKSVEFAINYGWSAGDAKVSATELNSNAADMLTLVNYTKIWTRDVNAEEEVLDPNYVTGGACNAFTRWSLTYVDGTKTKMKLTVSGNGALPKFETAGAPWYGYLNDIVEIEVCEGVTEIGRCSFYGLKFVKTVTIADTVTSINDYAFSGCFLLKSIEIPASVTYIAETAFTKTGLTVIPTV